MSDWILVPLVIIGALAVAVGAVFFFRWFIPLIFGRKGKKFVDGMDKFTRNVNSTLAQRYKEQEK